MTEQSSQQQPPAMTVEDAKRFVAQQEAHEKGEMARFDIQSEITCIDRAIFESVSHIKGLAIKQKDFLDQMNKIPVPPEVGTETLKQARKVLDDLGHTADSPAS